MVSAAPSPGIIRGANCWLVHHSEEGPLYEFGAIVEVANYLAFVDRSVAGEAGSGPCVAPAETPKWVSEFGR
jgi:hypothetical protein